MTNAAPEAIYQMIADTVSERLLEGDLDSVMANLALPFTMVTLGGKVVYRTQEELRIAIDAGYQSMRLRHITDHIRLVQFARYDREDRIFGEHITNTLCRGVRDIAPYRSCMVIERGADEIWRVTYAAHAISNAAFPVYKPAVSDGERLPDDHISDEVNAVRRLSNQSGTTPPHKLSDGQNGRN